MASLPYEIARRALEARIDELGRWLPFWTTLVVLGLIFEYGAELAERVPKRWRPKKVRLSFRWIGLWWFIGMLLITGGVSGELAIGVWTSRAEGKLRDLNNTFIAKLREDATSAAQDASRAKSDAKEAAGAARSALLEANAYKGQIEQATKEADAAHSSALTASNAASGALKMAQDARQEADSFERRIAKAEQDATAAEEHLAEAMGQAREATAELNRLKTPRSLTRVSELISSLAPFKGTKYRLDVSGDQESIELLVELNNALQNAGWVREPLTQFPLNIPTFKIGQPDFKGQLILSCIDTGIGIRVRSTETPSVLNAKTRQEWPRGILAGQTLQAALVLSISPANDKNVVPGILDQELGKEDTPMIICVGKKP